MGFFPHSLTEPNHDLLPTDLEAPPIRLLTGRDRKGRFYRPRIEQRPTDPLVGQKSSKPSGWNRAQRQHDNLLAGIETKRVALKQIENAKKGKWIDAKVIGDRYATIPKEVWDRAGDGQKRKLNKWVNTGNGQARRDQIVTRVLALIG
jgi:hypothetical protein